MGYADYGGGPQAGHASHDGGTHTGGTSIADLTGPTDRAADVTVDLVARKESFELVSGRRVDGYTFNHQSPGPLIEATVGQLVEVRVRNEAVPDGMTVHWHGVDVPNAEDGVAGVTQDAIHVGEQYVYRFVVDHVGTYWYHSHQVSHEQVIRGLLGPLVVHPAKEPDQPDMAVVSHTYGGHRTLNGLEEPLEIEAADGETARVRVINTDNGAVQVWGSPYRILAVDGYELHEPPVVSDTRASVPAGGRYDVEVTAPARLQVGASAVLVGGGTYTATKPPQPRAKVDLLSYGTPTATGLDASHPDRIFRYSIGRRPGFVDGKPGLWWSINGHLWPNVPMFMVDEGDVVVFDIENHSGQVHPMHLHGHHALVLSRDGKPATGSPWWVDSLDVESGEKFRIAFKADNPGIWMDHCHNLKHAAQGLVAHLMYADVTTPYLLGHDSGNEPE
jgi:FtsP/CotA-like multicopper oxidase with cupredoxin domain